MRRDFRAGNWEIWENPRGPRRFVSVDDPKKPVHLALNFSRRCSHTLLQLGTQTAAVVCVC